jgi:hypothetical protein
MSFFFASWPSRSTLRRNSSVASRLLGRQVRAMVSRPSPSTRPNAEVWCSLIRTTLSTHRASCF